jgi:hypothetical protein
MAQNLKGHSNQMIYREGRAKFRTMRTILSNLPDLDPTKSGEIIRWREHSTLISYGWTGWLRLPPPGIASRQAADHSRDVENQVFVRSWARRTATRRLRDKTAKPLATLRGARSWVRNRSWLSIASCCALLLPLV